MNIQTFYLANMLYVIRQNQTRVQAVYYRNPIDASDMTSAEKKAKVLIKNYGDRLHIIKS